MDERVETDRLLLRAIDVGTASELLAGRRPPGLRLAHDYPSEFSLEVMELVAGPRANRTAQLGPFFVIRKSDGAVIGEIGAALIDDRETAQIGYSLVRSAWKRGYATEALRGLLGQLGGRVRRAVGETFVSHAASRRVMEKAGMVERARRRGKIDGETAELVVYEVELDEAEERAPQALPR